MILTIYGHGLSPIFFCGEDAAMTESPFLRLRDERCYTRDSLTHEGPFAT